jgi:hypothetical protein
MQSCLQGVFERKIFKIPFEMIAMIESTLHEPCGIAHGFKLNEF